jgi:fused signal recognition particle receptor
VTEAPRQGLFARLSGRFAESTARLRGQLTGLAAYGAIDGGFWEALEETLLASDMGPDVGLRLARDIRREGERLGFSRSVQAVEGLRTMLVARMDWRPRELNDAARPTVILVVGVNGTGKTTSAAKLAARYRGEGARVVLGGADTFRAGATQQLRLWAERLGADLVTGEPGSDPAAVAFNSIEAGRARGARAVVIDTAGRLHTQSNLMAELAKIERSVAKAMEGAPHETLLTIDAALGQNSIQQARVFHDGIRLSGAILTKLDGSSKGGVVFGLEEQLGVPVKLVGMGEQANDLEPFDPHAYVDALFGPR